MKVCYFLELYCLINDIRHSVRTLCAGTPITVHRMFLLQPSCWEPSLDVQMCHLKPAWALTQLTSLVSLPRAILPPLYKE